jgi:hypothetical protein
VADPAPALVRVRATPSAVRRVGAGCADRTAVTAAVRASSAVTGIATWPGGRARARVSGGRLSATVGPFRSAAAAVTVTVTVTDADGRSATGRTTVSLRPCPAG